MIRLVQTLDSKKPKKNIKLSETAVDQMAYLIRMGVINPLDVESFYEDIIATIYHKVHDDNKDLAMRNAKIITNKDNIHDTLWSSFDSLMIT